MVMLGGFVIYAVVIPSLTIVFGLIQYVLTPSTGCMSSPRFRMFWAQPRTEVVFLFVAGVLWLSTYL